MIFRTATALALIGFPASAQVIWQASAQQPVVEKSAVEKLPADKPVEKPAAATLAPPRPIEYKPLYASERTPLPIDLVTALRLANASNPTIARAQAAVREALARLDQASVLWLPNLAGGMTYIRHDGQTQNQRGEVFGVSRSSLFGGGGPQLRVEIANALYAPLVARRLSEAATAQAQAVSNDIQLEVALSYLELLQTYALVAVNDDTLARAEAVLRSAEAGSKAGLNKTAADVNRAATEVQLRRQDAILLKGRIGAASARLTRLLLLDPAVDLVPVDPTVLPVTLVPKDWTLEQLIATGMSSRPEITAARAVIDASETRVRQARMGPLIPKLQADYLGGTFGGGRNSDVSDFSARSDLTVQLFWELRNLGFGNRGEVRERRAVAEQAYYQSLEIQARIGAEVSESAKLAGARFATLNAAQSAVKEAAEMYRKFSDTAFQGVGPGGRGQFEALEPLTAIQALNQARMQYFSEVIEFNRAQFRLFNAIGQPALNSLDTAETTKLSEPVVPATPGAVLMEPKKAKP